MDRLEFRQAIGECGDYHDGRTEWTGLRELPVRKWAMTRNLLEMAIRVRYHIEGSCCHVLDQRTGDTKNSRHRWWRVETDPGPSKVDVR